MPLRSFLTAGCQIQTFSPVPRVLRTLTEWTDPAGVLFALLLGGHGFGWSLLLRPAIDHVDRIGRFAPHSPIRFPLLLS